MRLPGLGAAPLVILGSLGIGLTVGMETAVPPQPIVALKDAATSPPALSIATLRLAAAPRSLEIPASSAAAAIQTRPAPEPRLALLRKRASSPGGDKIVKTSVQGFSFYLPGDLIKGTSPIGGAKGALDDIAHAPWIRFPLESGPAYVNSQVWGWGGRFGLGGGECDRRNYSYPWRDNFCESRGRLSGACPGGVGHQGVDIRPSSCDDNAHWAVAAEDGRIVKVGSYGVTLRGESGYEYRYLHVNTARAAVKRGQKVKSGQRIALISNFFDGTPTSIHLHFEMRRPKSEGGVGELVSPYASLIPAYLRLLLGDSQKATVALASAVTAPRPKQPPPFKGVAGRGASGGGWRFRDCKDCPQMIRVRGGRTLIGSPPSEAGRKRNEGPQKKVRLRGFSIGKTEVTRRQWSVCVRDGYCAPPRRGMAWPDLDQPVTGVSRADITGDGAATKGFIAWINAKAKKRGRRARYRLPTEAEWEHALRAGKRSAYHTGKSITPKQANYDARFNTAYPSEIRARRGPVKAGALPSNRWGLREMAGNVWEWTSDCWAPDHASTPKNGKPRGPKGCRDGVIRGGSLFSFQEDLRAARRAKLPGNRARKDVGFRLVRD